jgi:hypothetical protein
MINNNVSERTTQLFHSHEPRAAWNFAARYVFYNK